MVATEATHAELAHDHISLAQPIASRLRWWYSWLALDDLESYAYLGLVLAAKSFQADRGIPFAKFACRKAMFLAIDEMRRDGVAGQLDTWDVLQFIREVMPPLLGRTILVVADRDSIRRARQMHIDTIHRAEAMPAA